MSRITPETKVKNQIIEYAKSLEKQGYNILHFRRDAIGKNYKKGLPDMYLIVGCYHIEVEFKAENGSLSSLQELWQKRFTAMGTPYMVVYSLDDFKSQLNIYLNK